MPPLRVGPVPLCLLACLSAWPDPCPAERAYQSVGRSATYVPLLNFSSDDGTGYGVRLNLFSYDGRTVPYRSKLSAQLFATTGGKQVHRLLWDAPAWRTGRRLQAEFVYEKEEEANYFGGLAPDALAGFSRKQKTFSQAAPALRLSWIGDLRGPWRLRLGGRLAHTAIDPNAAGSVLEALAPLGADGGTLLQGSAALRHDTRDDYNDTAAGALAEAAVQYSVGGGFDYNGALFSAEYRRFWGLSALVLAHRLSLDWSAGGLPFYEELPLGGSSTVRGAASARQRGQARLLLNAELRWRGVRLWRGQRMYLGGVLFGDIGQTFARDALPAAGDWRRGRGAGARFFWHSTIVRADYAVSGRRTAIYITFSQVF